MSEKKQKGVSGFARFGLGLKKGFQAFETKLGTTTLSEDVEYDTLKSTFYSEKEKMVLYEKKMRALMKIMTTFSQSISKVTPKVIDVLEEFVDNGETVKENSTEFAEKVEGFQTSMTDFVGKLESECITKCKKFDEMLTDNEKTLYERDNQKIQFDKQAHKVKTAKTTVVKKNTEKNEDRLTLEESKFDEQKISYRKTNKEAQDALVDVLNERAAHYLPFNDSFFELVDASLTEMVTSIDHVAACVKSYSESVRGQYNVGDEEIDEISSPTEEDEGEGKEKIDEEKTVDSLLEDKDEKPVEEPEKPAEEEKEEPGLFDDDVEEKKVEVEEKKEEEAPPAEEEKKEEPEEEKEKEEPGLFDDVDL